MLLPMAIGAVLTAGGFLLFAGTPDPGRGSSVRVSSGSNAPDAGCRTVAQLLALSDEELERVDVLELNIAVAREIPGCEHLDYQRYKRIVDEWTDDVRRLESVSKDNFSKTPHEWNNDINFFRLGLLATYLTRDRGVRYHEKYSADQKAGKSSKYIEPGALLIHDLIDTLRGTCANMPVLHVIIGRRLGLPVSLASVGPHYVCRYDDGKVHYNIEATYEGPGFVSDSDQDYVKDIGLPQKAATTGSDFRSLTAREMLGVFVGSRARYYWDTDQREAAYRDYIFSQALYPNHRANFRESVRAIVWQGEQLFEPYETGHPATMAQWLVSTYLRLPQGPPDTTTVHHAPPTARRNSMYDEEINAITRASVLPRPPTDLQPVTVAPAVPQPNRAPIYGAQQQPRMPQPGVPQPYQPPTYQPPMPGQPRR